METEYDDKVLDYWSLPTQKCRVNFKNYDGLESDRNVENKYSSHLDAFIFSNSKRNITRFIGETKRFYKNSIYYSDTDSFYIEKKLGCFGLGCLLGSFQCEGKKDYNSGVLFYCLIPAPKTKYCLSIDRYVIIQQHMTFEGLNDSKPL